MQLLIFHSLFIWLYGREVFFEPMDVACATYACNGRHVEANSTYIQQVHALNGHILCAGLYGDCNKTMYPPS